MFDVIRSKKYWLVLVLVGAIIGIFSFALIGVRNSVKVKQIPVALVNEDKGTLSNKFEHKLRTKFSGKNSKIKWVSPQKNGFNNQKYYGSFILIYSQRYAKYPSNTCITRLMGILYFHLLSTQKEPQLWYS